VKVGAVFVHAIKAVLRRLYVEVIGQVHASTVLLPMREPTIAVEEGAGWASETACVV
jgi:hypothetical protein